MATQQDEFLEEMKKKYDDLNYRWSIERDKFEATLQHAGVDARKEYEAKLEDFRKYRAELKTKIDGLEASGDKAWEDLKEGAENSWKSMSDAFGKAISQFK